MRGTGRLVIEFEDEATAEAVLQAVEVDNEGYVTSERRGAAVFSETEADNLGTLLQTLDDLLACIGVAEKVAREA